MLTMILQMAGIAVVVALLIYLDTVKDPNAPAQDPKRLVRRSV